MTIEMTKKLEALGKPTIRLQPHNEKCNSKYGGFPCVNDEQFQWPTYNGNPLAFLGQVDLEEMSNVMSYEWLPATGYLLFFYDIIEQCGGFDAEERDSWRVIYQEKPTINLPHPEDIDVEAKFPEVFLAGIEAQRLPPHAEHIHFPTLEYDISEKEFLPFHDMKYAEFDGDAPFHQFAGYPTDPCFNSLKLEAHAMLNSTRSYFSPDLLSLSDEGKAALSSRDPSVELDTSDAIAKLKAGATDWTLLLQIDTDLGVSDEFAFGDGEKLFFYVQKDKAREKNFEDCWMLMQVLY